MGRKVAVIAAGGTIAMHGRSPYDWVDYADSGVIHEMSHVISTLDMDLGNIEVGIHQFRLLGSTAITWSDWFELAGVICRLAREDSDIRGFVVTHGTASLEETAWFLNLVVQQPLPVVLVGGQRPPNTVGSDVAPNLRAAIFVAADDLARSRGTLVVMNQYVFSARDVTKLANFDLGAFRSPEFGPLGRVDTDGTVAWRHIPASRRPSPIFAAALESGAPARVDIVTSYAGADGVAIKAYVDAGARGLISAGMPPGRCTPDERIAFLEAVARGVVVVQSSRATIGGVPRQRYNEADGILAGGDLPPNKLRVLLGLALRETQDRDELQELIFSL